MSSVPVAAAAVYEADSMMRVWGVSRGSEALLRRVVGEVGGVDAVAEGGDVEGFAEGPGDFFEVFGLEGAAREVGDEFGELGGRDGVAVGAGGCLGRLVLERGAEEGGDGDEAGDEAGRGLPIPRRGRREFVVEGGAGGRGGRGARDDAVLCGGRGGGVEVAAGGAVQVGERVAEAVGVGEEGARGARVRAEGSRERELLLRVERRVERGERGAEGGEEVLLRDEARGRRGGGLGAAERGAEVEGGGGAGRGEQLLGGPLRVGEGEVLGGRPS